MAIYLVTWMMEVEAETPLDAAKQAYRHMRRPDSTANEFKVKRTGKGSKGAKSTSVDLGELAEGGKFNLADLQDHQRVAIIMGRFGVTQVMCETPDLVDVAVLDPQIHEYDRHDSHIHNVGNGAEDLVHVRHMKTERPHINMTAVFASKERDDAS